MRASGRTFQLCARLLSLISAQRRFEVRICYLVSRPARRDDTRRRNPGGALILAKIERGEFDEKKLRVPERLLSCSARIAESNAGGSRQESDASARRRRTGLRFTRVLVRECHD